VQIGYFTERPYRWLDEDEVLENRAFFAVPNSRFDHVRGADDYNFFLDEYCAAEELGFDALALNEHHGNPYCMGSVMNVEAAILARITERVKIILIGNPLPVIKHPLRMAEELATIDLISRGRLVTGWVRGAGSEQFFNNANPAYNREMFVEAHDFIVQAWTRPGPWRYEGKHFHYRHVNPWALPYQKPHPPMWIPGVLSPETILWCAEHQYPYIGLGTALGPTCEMWDIYADRAAELGYQAGPQNFGYLASTFVADTDEKAQELGKGFVWAGGQGAFSAPQFTVPPGYNSKEAIRRLAKAPGGSWLGVNRDKLMQQAAEEDRPSALPKEKLDEIKMKQDLAYKRGQTNHQLLIGTPDKVIGQLKTILAALRPGVFIFFHVQGPVSNEDRLRSLELMAKYVVPEVRAYASEIGLDDPFQVPPGSQKVQQGAQRDAVHDRGLLESLGLR
jgi:alkanesulfonate monooxygenase SsuD/methylene tetrahydromethanopterin reductase-like flavin-dependent oxidoreductase (luciferase family)